MFAANIDIEEDTSFKLGGNSGTVSESTHPEPLNHPQGELYRRDSSPELSQRYQYGNWLGGNETSEGKRCRNYRHAIAGNKQAQRLPRTTNERLQRRSRQGAIAVLRKQDTDKLGA